MKKLITLALLVAILAVATISVFAGEVYDREWKTLTAGSGTLTITRPYAAVKLARIFVYGSTVATDTCTVTRVTSGTVSTQTVGTVVIAAGAGNTATFTAGYLSNGDSLVFDTVKNSNAVAIVEYEVQKH